MAVGGTGANGHRTTTPSGERSLFAQVLVAVPPVKAWQSEPTVAFGRARSGLAGRSVVAFSAGTRAAGRPSTFRTGLAL